MFENAAGGSLTFTAVTPTLSEPPSVRESEPEADSGPVRAVPLELPAVAAAALDVVAGRKKPADRIVRTTTTMAATCSDARVGPPVPARRNRPLPGLAVIIGQTPFWSITVSKSGIPLVFGPETWRVMEERTRTPPPGPCGVRGRG